LIGKKVKVVAERTNLLYGIWLPGNQNGMKTGHFVFLTPENASKVEKIFKTEVP